MDDKNNENRRLDYYKSNKYKILLNKLINNNILSIKICNNHNFNKIKYSGYHFGYKLFKCKYCKIIKKSN